MQTRYGCTHKSVEGTYRTCCKRTDRCKKPTSCARSIWLLYVDRSPARRAGGKTGTDARAHTHTHAMASRTLSGHILVRCIRSRSDRARHWSCVWFHAWVRFHGYPQIVGTRVHSHAWIHTKGKQTRKKCWVQRECGMWMVQYSRWVLVAWLIVVLRCIRPEVAIVRLPRPRPSQPTEGKQKMPGTETHSQEWFCCCLPLLCCQCKVYIYPNLASNSVNSIDWDGGPQETRHPQRNQYIHSDSIVHKLGNSLLLISKQFS